MPVVEVIVTALKDVWKPKANPTIPVYEENGKLKRGLRDKSAKIDLVGWDPSPLGHNRTLSSFDAEVQGWRWILGRDPERRSLHMRHILRDIPHPPEVGYAIVSQEIRCSEQECEESICVLGRKHVREEAVHKNVDGCDRGLHITMD